MTTKSLDIFSRLCLEAARCRRCSPRTPNFACVLGQQARQFRTSRAKLNQSVNEDAKSAQIDFGFRKIESKDKEAMVGNVFTSVASSYDYMNDLMSLGVHRLWKDYFVRSIRPGNKTNGFRRSNLNGVEPELEQPAPQVILDVAGGTGDIALRLLDHMTLVNGDTRSRVIVSDINSAMLEEGKKRLAQTPYGAGLSGAPNVDPFQPSKETSEDRPTQKSRLSFLTANAETFPTVPNESVDLYTVAFGIRNFTSIPNALTTAYRVLKPGGVFACLEFSHIRPGLSLIDSLYKRWSFGVIPIIGQLAAGDRESYQYLVESIERFPDQQTFMSMIRAAGFHIPRQNGDTRENGTLEQGWVDLSGGIAAIHKGVKPLAQHS